MLTACVNFSKAQIGGESIYSFLRLTTSSNYASLGGFSPSVNIKGVNSVFSNPALVDSLDNLSASVNIVAYVAGINYGSVCYGGRVGEEWLLSGALQFVNYGEFSQTDETAADLGTFSCADRVFMVSASRNLSPQIRFGASAKAIFSSLENYRSSGLAFDLGFLYNIDSQKIALALTAQNLGCQLTKYTPGEREKLPFDLLLGFSKTLLHAPFRFSVTVHDLQKPKLDDDFLTSFANHFIVSAELFPEKTVSPKAGFNFQRHNDLYVSGLTPFPGFSVGIDVRLKRFSVQYSRQCLSPAASSNLFTAEIFFSQFAVR